MWRVLIFGLISTQAHACHYTTALLQAKKDGHSIELSVLNGPCNVGDWKPTSLFMIQRDGVVILTISTNVLSEDDLELLAKTFQPMELK